MSCVFPIYCKHSVKGFFSKRTYQKKHHRICLSFICLFIYLSIYLYLPVYQYLSFLSIYIPLSTSIYPYISISIYPYLSLSLPIFPYLSISVSIFLSFCLSINQSIYLSIYLSYLSILLAVSPTEWEDLGPI